LNYEKQERDWNGNGTGETSVYLMRNLMFLVSVEGTYSVKARLNTAKPSCAIPLILTGLNLEVKFWYMLDEDITKIIA
jgi:hypothetical protein